LFPAVGSFAVKYEAKHKGKQMLYKNGSRPVTVAVQVVTRIANIQQLKLLAFKKEAGG